MEAPSAVERRLAAILSADVVGYSRLMGEDEEATVHTLTSYRDVLAGHVAKHRGRVVDAPGDNLLAEFSSAYDAVLCASEAQRSLQTRNLELPERRQMEFRMGVHVGDVVVEGEKIYGDGVNIAARLEGIAEPGGLCISSGAYDQVRSKLEAECDDLGECELKNIAHPVRAYRVKLGQDTAPRAGADLSLSVPGFAGRPAIAVLPFEDMSGDPEQEFFADGIAEDILTRLARWRHFPVIARNSSFVYKGKSVDVKQVSRELGVRYVLEGSVRKAGSRVRVTAQLIDATSGHHVWAERYDRELEDIFVLQDEITSAIVGALHPELLSFESERTAQGESSDLDAWESAHRGWWHWNRTNREDNEVARRLLERAVELDPRFAFAWAGLAMVDHIAIAFGWSTTLSADLEHMLAAAQRAVALDEKDAFAQLALACAYSLTSDPGKMVAAARRAVQLNPSLPLAYDTLGQLLIVRGSIEEGMSYLESGMRISPNDPLMADFHFGMSVAMFVAGRYEESLEWCDRAFGRRGDYQPIGLMKAMNLVMLGRVDDAKAWEEEWRGKIGEINPEALDLALRAAVPGVRELFREALAPLATMLEDHSAST